ncbi:MAG: MATE family efflux transporter, partial [Lachnospiraceae bacterium]|nr:MATE family efflux transporter [Lachnospiraceae bacterium]
TFALLLTSCLIYSTVLWATVQLFPEMYIRIFNNDPELVVYTCRAIKIYMAVACVFGAQVACQQTFIAIGNAKSSLFLALLRKIILLIPLIYLLPQLMTDKETAVFMAEPVADFLAVTTTVTLFTIQFKKAMQRLDNREQ